MGRKKKIEDIDKMKEDIKTNTRGYYVRNELLLPEIIKSREQNAPTEDLIAMFTAIARKLSNRWPYKYPEDKEDCIQRAVLDCILYWDRFDITKSENPNPFAYFTSVCGMGLRKGWNELGYNKEKGIPFSKRVYLTNNIFSI